MSVRCKMRLNAVIGQTWGGVKACFNCEYDNDIPEDQRFQKATPSGMLELQIDNPAAIEQLVIGKAYYFDMTPAAAG
ncbi:Uncharacterised protein [Burkholderia pseudomallei]|nr:Uncharacterised protein [Burkholderia pseudomallei]